MRLRFEKKLHTFYGGSTVSCEFRRRCPEVISELFCVCVIAVFLVMPSFCPYTPQLFRRCSAIFHQSRFSLSGPRSPILGGILVGPVLSDFPPCVCFSLSCLRSPMPEDSAIVAMIVRCVGGRRGLYLLVDHVGDMQLGMLELVR